MPKRIKKNRKKTTRSTFSPRRAKRPTPKATSALKGYPTPVFYWNEEKGEMVRSLAMNRSSGLVCSSGACDRSACPGLPSEVEKFSQLAPFTLAQIVEEHLKLHITMADYGPLPLCPEHQGRVPIQSRCNEHSEALKQLFIAYKNLMCWEVPQVFKYLDSLVEAYQKVEIAARAGTTSERRRTMSKKKPRSGAPPVGWNLGRDILQNANLSQEFLPKTRSEYPGGKQFVIKVRGREFRLSRTQMIQHLIRRLREEERKAWDAYHEATLPDAKAFMVGLLGGADRKTLDRLYEKRCVAHERNLHLRQKAQKASDRFREFMESGESTLQSGEKIKLPGSPLSRFWTETIRKLWNIYKPLTDRVKNTLEHGWYSTPARVVLFTLRSLFPRHHLRTTHRDIHDRIRPISNKTAFQGPNS